MPYLNRLGEVAHGVGGGNASFNNVVFGIGGVGGWINDDEIVFANGNDNWLISAYNVRSTRTRRLNPVSSGTILAAGGSHAAWQLQTDKPEGGYLFHHRLPFPAGRTLRDES